MTETILARLDTDWEELLYHPPALALASALAAAAALANVEFLR